MNSRVKSHANSRVASDTMKKGHLKIGELAKEVGMTPDSVRFYERSGLLQEPERLASGYRVYEKSAVRRLRFIKKAQSLGFSLREIKQILGLCGQGSGACPSVVALAERKLIEVEQRIEDLKAFARKLEANLAEWRKESTQESCLNSEFCSLIESACDSDSSGERRLNANGRRSSSE